MWIKCTNGDRINFWKMVSLTKHRYTPDGAAPSNPGFEWLWSVRMDTAQDYFVLADELTEAEADALVDDVITQFCDDARLCNIDALLDGIRRGVAPETGDDQMNLTEKGRAFLREGEVRELDHYGEAR